MNRTIRTISATILTTAATTMAFAVTAPSAEAHPIKWKHSQVYVVDSTTLVNSRWDIKPILPQWGAGSKFNYTRRTFKQGCPKHKQCLYVSQGILPDGIPARTSAGWNKYNNIQFANIIVDHNFGTRHSKKINRRALRHELGHGLGILHHYKAPSVMTEYLEDTHNDKPSKGDIHQVVIRYGK